MPTTLSPEQLALDLAIRDLTNPAEGPHAIQILVDHAVHSLAERWSCEVRVSHGPRIVSVADNYDNLGYEAEAITREARYSRYVDDRRMLRSHTSAMIPSALRILATRPADDVLLVCPGITYRRDAIDRLHTGTPHQLDLWRIARRPLGNAAMDEMIELLATAIVPGNRYRSEAREHPYTLEGRQVDVERSGEWVEVWECGLAHPSVLRQAGLDGWNGLALGMGLDRLLMLRKDVPDIRLLRSDDPRVARQMTDLEPYRAVSSLPTIQRDLSVAVAADDTCEDIGDRVRNTLGAEAALIEEVGVLSETAYRDLPPAAISRLGMDSAQKNLLVRLLIRPVDRTLTDREANRVRDRVYEAIHQGSSAR